MMEKKCRRMEMSAAGPSTGSGTAPGWRLGLIGSENGGILSLPDLGNDIKGWAGRWRTMGVALNRFLGTFIVLENVENRIKTLF